MDASSEPSLDSRYQNPRAVDPKNQTDNAISGPISTIVPCERAFSKLLNNSEHVPANPNYGNRMGGPRVR